MPDIPSPKKISNEDKQTGLFIVGVLAFIGMTISGYMIYNKIEVPGELWSLLSMLTGGILGFIRSKN